jgi:hypothetical protein
MGGSVPLALLKIVNLTKIDCRFRGLCLDADFSRETSETHQIMIKLSRTHLEGIAPFILNLCTGRRRVVSVTTLQLLFGKEPTVCLKL